MITGCISGHLEKLFQDETTDIDSPVQLSTELIKFVSRINFHNARSDLFFFGNIVFYCQEIQKRTDSSDTGIPDTCSLGCLVQIFKIEFTAFFREVRKQKPFQLGKPFFRIELEYFLLAQWNYVDVYEGGYIVTDIGDVKRCFYVGTEATQKFMKKMKTNKAVYLFWKEWNAGREERLGIKK